MSRPWAWWKTMTEFITIQDIARAMAPRVQESPYVPDKVIYIMDDLGVGTPEGWAEMTDAEKLLWSADHGHLLLVKDVR